MYSRHGLFEGVHFLGLHNHTSDITRKLKIIQQPTSMGIKLNDVLNHSRPANLPRNHIFTPWIIKLVDLIVTKFLFAFGRLLLEFHGLLVKTTSASKSTVLTQIAVGRTVLGPAIEAFTSIGLHAFFADVAVMAVQRAF